MEEKKPPIRKVEKLPDEAVKNEVIYNLEDRCFYMGIETQEESNGSNLEETSIRR